MEYADAEPAGSASSLEFLCLRLFMHFTWRCWSLFCWPTVPVFVRPALVARGEGGSATPSSVVLYVPNDLEIANSSSPPLLSLPTPARKKPQKAKLRKRNNVIEEADKTPNPAEVGSENGSAYDGLASGDEVKPALPVAFQDLKIPRSELPSGIQGVT